MFTLQAAWENGGCSNSQVNQEMKRVGEMSRAGNFALHLKYVPWPATKMWLTCLLVLCLTLTVLCPRLRGQELNQGSASTRLILCLWTVTVAEAEMEISCLTSRLGRSLILEEQMFSHSQYLVGITSTFFPLSSLMLIPRIWAYWVYPSHANSRLGHIHHMPK